MVSLSAELLCFQQTLACQRRLCIVSANLFVFKLALLHRTGYAEVRRGRRLVVSFIMTAVNYEYCFFWHLYQVGGLVTVSCYTVYTGVIVLALLAGNQANGDACMGRLQGSCTLIALSSRPLSGCPTTTATCFSPHQCL
eukprot:GHRR01033863.1.p1 GENE.GHRR01033863.1~~GHRR01033863.1.p1  ORF type:complete len:139 (-),score=9.88 GHRR01033863.1:30-446(-)